MSQPTDQIVEVEAETAETPTPTPRKEPIFSPDVPPACGHEYRRPAIQEVRKPSAGELLSAVRALAGLIGEDTSSCTELDPGDAELVYDLTLRIHGEKPIRLKNIQPLQALFSPSGMDTAPGDLEAALDRVFAPLRNRVLDVINARNGNEKPVIKFRERLT